MSKASKRRETLPGRKLPGTVAKWRRSIMSPDVGREERFEAFKEQYLKENPDYISDAGLWGMSALYELRAAFQIVEVNYFADWLPGFFKALESMPMEER